MLIYKYLSIFADILCFYKSAGITFLEEQAVIDI